MELSSSYKVNVGRPCYIPGEIFGPFSFINIFSGQEVKGAENGMKNTIEVAVTLRIVKLLYKECASSKHKISIAVLSPYHAQVQSLQQKLERHYENNECFKVNVGFLHEYHGGEADVMIISTVGAETEIDACIELVRSRLDANVYMTWARRCLWILGDERVLLKGGSYWEPLILDAKVRQCFFQADEHKDLAKVIVEVKKDLRELDELLIGETSLFRSTTWKVFFSSKFLTSFSNIELWETKKLVLLMLLKLSGGWRPKRSSTAASVCESPYSELMKEFQVRGLHLICTVDIVKETHYVQVLKLWDVLPFHEITELVNRLEGIIRRYTQQYIDHCKAKCVQGGSEFPLNWPAKTGIIQYKHPESCGECVEDVNVRESLILMKFYSFSSGSVNSMISGCDGGGLGLPIELTEQEKDVVSFDKTSFILGRSGTGKTTVLTTKLFRNEQLHHLACEGFHEKIDSNEEVKQDVLRQLFVTLSPRLCYAVKQHVGEFKRLTCGGSLSSQSTTAHIDDIDKMMMPEDIPDHFFRLPHNKYPLVITFHRFLLMLDGTVGTSYFERLRVDRRLAGGNKKKNSRLDVLRLKDVTYERFCSIYWPHFNDKLTKNLDPSTVYTEIMSVIKGGLTAGRAPNGILHREDYVALCDARTSVFNAQKRETIYSIFVQYEKIKMEKGNFDLADLVNDLHERLQFEGYKGDSMDYVYIDEVQDLTMKQIMLFKYVCRNVHQGYAFSGDTAQAIAKGIGFRFEDIRLLFFSKFLLGSEKGKISKIFQLSENFRTHAGVLNLAQSVIDLLSHFFPLFVDALHPETSRIDGKLPILLETDASDNAIKTIFQNIGDGSLNGFGAEQVVLVRDEYLKEKVVKIVGKNALVLTIMESKGLEFQDVLLYDFFTTSPLSNEWRIIYQYMMEKGLNLSSTALCACFDMEKHIVICSELKQLYVAITRTRQRLWICETEGFSQPIFSYWKKLRLVEVKHVNDSFADEMQIPSSKDEWRSRGVKLFYENNFRMAHMCFLKAGDEYSERLTKAYLLREIGDASQYSLVERKKLFKEAAELFSSLGKHKLAAECYFEMEDYKTAGEEYVKASMSEKAGNCFSLARCYGRAVEEYEKAGAFSKCLIACTDGKLFDMGFQLIQRWGGRGDAELAFLQKGARYYFAIKDSKRMMIFVSAFDSKDEMRGFLTKRRCFDELISLEVEWGNFEEAFIKCLNACADEKLFEKGFRLIQRWGGCGDAELEFLQKGVCYYFGIKDYKSMMTFGNSFHSKDEMRRFLTKRRCFDELIFLEVEWGNYEEAFIKCLNACADGKLFEKGFRLIQRWGGRGDAELAFLQKGARYYFAIKDLKRMMIFVSAFDSKDEMRGFLTKRRCFDELISLEVEWGNFEEAFIKCLNACADEKLFEKGFRLIQRWGGCGDAELEFLQKGVCYYFGIKDYKSMMTFGNSFHSKDEMRRFLTKRRCFDELIFLEVEWGNYEEAFIKCLNACADGKLFEKGFRLIQRWGGRGDAELAFLQKGARYYFAIKDLKRMMIFVSAFDSKDEMRGFLTKRRCFDELISLEVEWGNFEEAFIKCLNACADEKLFEKGFRLIQRWGGCGDAELEFLQKGVCYYFGIKDYKSMMTFGNSFHSKDEMRRFLTKRRCFDELIFLEVEWGNYEEAFIKCLNACADGKLFEKGFRLIQRWGGRGDAELAFLQKGARYYFAIKDLKRMMIFVSAFDSKDEMRGFLTKRRCFDELISLEVEWGNFEEAFIKCLNACADEKLFEKGFRLIQRWGGCGDAELEFLQKGVCYYFGIKDYKSMMTFGNSFHSKDEMRRFLTKRRCFDELIFLEVEWGNYEEAAKVAKLKSVPVHEARMGGFQSFHRESSLIILWHVFVQIPAFQNSGEPFTQKDELLTKAVSIAKRGPDEFHRFVCKGAEILSQGKTQEDLLKKGLEFIDFYKKNDLAVSLQHVKTTREIEKIEEDVLDQLHFFFKSENRLKELWRSLSETPRERSLRIHFLISRRILGVYLESDCSLINVSIETWVEDEKSKHLESELSNSIVSIEGLMYFWSYFKKLIGELLNWSCMRGEGCNDTKIYEDFLCNYFGVRKYGADKSGSYVVLNAEAQWVKQMNPYMRRNGHLNIISAHKFSSVVSKYWCSELLFVAEKVLRKLRSLHAYSTVKNFSMHQHMQILKSLFEFAKSLQKWRFPNSSHRANRIVDQSFQLCLHEFMSNVFHINWKTAQSKEMISLRGNETFLNMLKEAINVKSKSPKGLTCEQLGYIAMIFLGFKRIELNDDIKTKVKGISSLNWKDLFDKVADDKSSSKNVNLAISLHRVLKETLYEGWLRANDSMSPSCLLYLMERLLIMSFCFRNYVFVTRSSCVEWLTFEELGMDSNEARVTCLETMKEIHHSLVSMVGQVLNSLHDLLKWATRSKEESYGILVLRLTVLLSMICINSGQHYHLLLDLLQRPHFASVLPSTFSEGLIKGIKEDCLVDAVAIACEKIDNPLVVVSFTKESSEGNCGNAIFLNMVELDFSRKKIIEILYQNPEISPLSN